MKVRPPFLAAFLLSAAAAAATLLFESVPSPAWAVRRAEEGLSSWLGAPVRLGEVRFHPSAFELEIRDIRVEGSGGGPLLAVGRCRVTFDLAGILRGRTALREVEVDSPRLNLVREGPGLWNFSDILARLSGPGHPPPHLTLGPLRVVGGRVDLLDRTSGRRLVLAGVTGGLPGFSTPPSRPVRWTSLRLAGGALGGSFLAMARFAPFSEDLRPSLAISLRGMDVEAVRKLLPSDDGKVQLPPATVGGTLRATLRPSSGRGPEVVVAIGAQIACPTLFGRGSGPFPEGGGPSLSAEASYHPESGTLEARAEAAFAGLDLGRSLALVSAPALPPASGSAGGHLDGTFAVSPKKGPSLKVSGVIEVSALRLSEPGGPEALRARKALIRIAEADLSGRRIGLSEIRLEGVRTSAAGDARARFSRLFAGVKGRRGARGGRLLVTLDELRIMDGTIALGGGPADAGLLSDLHAVDLLAGPFSPSTSRPGRFALTARTSYGARCLAGGTFPQTLSAAEGTFHVTDIPLSRVTSRVMSGAGVGLGEGELETSGRFAFAPGSDGAGLTLSEMTLRARPILLTTAVGKEFLGASEVTAEGVRVDLSRREVQVGKILCPGGWVRLQRDASGSLNLLPPGRGEAPESPGWSITFAEVDLSGWRGQFEDWTPEEPASVNLRILDIHAEGISSTGVGTPARLQVEAVLEGGGSVSLTGHASLGPPSAKFLVAVREAPADLLLPYASGRFQPVVEDGVISAEGFLAAGEGSLCFDGEGLLARFRVLDRERWDELLRWDALHLGRVSLSLSPPGASVGEASLSDFFASATIRPDATLNLFHLWTPSQEASGPAVEGASFRLDQVVLQGGEVAFSDRFIRPSYGATLRGVGGRLSDFDSAGGTAGAIELRGYLGEGAPVEVVGFANPFRKDLFADIRASCRNVDLVSISAYAGRYAGYAISGGKLHLEVTYRLENRRLEAHSRVLLDQFELGERVEGGPASGLPLKLAVSLLKDEGGGIAVDVPLSGSLDDIQFDAKPLVGRMVKRAIARLLAAPFRFFQRMFRRGPQLGSVQFPAGSSEMSAEARRALLEAAGKLSSGPKLRLRVAGLFEPEVDEDGLKRVQLERRILSDWAAGVVRRGGDAGVGASRPSPSERSALLREVYRRQSFPKPRDIGGAPRELPDAEMENIIAAFTEIDLGDLRRLGVERASAVRSALVAAGVEEGRVYIVDPDAMPRSGEAARTRADFEIHR